MNATELIATAKEAREHVRLMRNRTGAADATVKTARILARQCKLRFKLAKRQRKLANKALHKAESKAEEFHEAVAKAVKAALKAEKKAKKAIKLSTLKPLTRKPESIPATNRAKAKPRPASIARTASTAQARRSNAVAAKHKLPSRAPSEALPNPHSGLSQAVESLVPRASEASA